MPVDEKSCPKCTQRMEPGFVPDFMYRTTHQSTWVAGAPQARLFVGGIKRPTGRQLPVVTYRCTQCGLLESYAHEQWSLAR